MASGCSIPTEATPYAGSCGPFEPVSWSPAGFSTGVGTDAVIRLQFDGYPDPDTLASDSLGMTTGFYWVPGVHRVDLIHRIAIMRPWQPLSPNLGYTVHVMPTLHSLQGCPATYAIRTFKTGDGPVGTEPPQVVPPFSEVQALFERRCGGGGCHLDHESGACAPEPAAGLSLCAAEAWDALVEVPSRQEIRLRLVNPGDSARSYLLRKLIPATPGGAPPPTVLGHRDPPGAPLDQAELEAVAAWIDGGAAR